MSEEKIEVEKIEENKTFEERLNDAYTRVCKKWGLSDWSCHKSRVSKQEYQNQKEITGCHS